MGERLRQNKPAAVSPRRPKPTNLLLVSDRFTPDTSALIHRAHQKPGSLSAEDVLHLQRTLGNATVRRLLSNRTQRADSPTPESHGARGQKTGVGPQKGPHERQ